MRGEKVCRMVKTRLGRDLGRRSFPDGDDQSKGGSVTDRPANTATAAPTENGFQSDSSHEEQYVRRKRRRSCHDDSEDSSNCGRRRLRRPRYMDSTAMRSSLSYYERNRLHLRSQNSNALGIRRSTRQKKLLYKTYNQNLIDKQLSLMEPDSEDDYVDKTKVKVSRRRRAPKYISEDDDLEDEDTEDTEVEVEQVVKIKSRPRLKSSETATTNKGENDEELGEDATKDGVHKERNSHDLRRGRPRNADKMNHEADVEEEEENEQPKQHHKRMEVEPIPEAEALDMYTRVKRERPQIKRDMYGLPINYDEKEEKSTSDSETQDQQSDDDSDDNAEQTKEKTTKNKSYNLRLHCRKTNLYSAPPIEPQRSYSRSVRTFRALASSKNDYRSPMRRRRKRAAFHSSTSSSSSSADEEQFERRKSKSMAKARQRCLPMNLTSEEVASGVVRDRMHSGASLADVEPMAIDKSVLFDSVGGLGKHLNALKEMILFPLLYPEVFSKFKITPPRGVLFHGPPGTGKTLVARALANECSLGNTKVAFFMRKGADCLSKWVGESERQLRLLFDQAYRMRPAIIFFDEIDGLAPVRSSRQDQIHSSIVSTLLALMDGLDDRGELVVIGATNRIHSIDPALRRPGRFDREFLFPLPSFEARKQIVKIHTKEWSPPLTEEFITDLARRTVGYCGADLKALCTEAALHALRRRYPQIYNSRDKLLIDVSTISILSSDFCRGMERIQPAAQRSSLSPVKALGEIVRPLLEAAFLQAVTSIQNIFPSALHSAPQSSSVGLADDDFSDEDFSQDGRLTLQTSASRLLPPIYRPRLLLAGDLGQGQSSHLGPALLHHLENLAVNVMDLPSLFAVETRTPEESCAQIMREARRSSPSVLYIPHINDLWDVIGDAVKSTFLTLLQDFDPSTPVLVLATSELRYDCLPPQVRDLFVETVNEVIFVNEPDASKRRAFFENLILQQVSLPPVSRKKPERKLEVLPKAPNPEPRKLTAVEEERLVEQEEVTLRELRLFLRDVINKLGRDRKFCVFLKPVDILEVPDYHEIIKTPMDLSTMMSRIDLHQYETVLQFLQDIDLICSNALEYNPDKDPQDRAIRHRACALKDTTNAIIATELDPEFGKLCEDIAKARKNRGYVSKTMPVPNFYFTKPLTTSTSANADGGTLLCGRRSQEGKETNSSCEKTNKDNVSQKTPENDNYPRKVIKKIRFCRSRKTSGFKSPWCRTNRRMYKKVVVYVDRDGKEMSEGEFKKMSSNLQTSKDDQQLHERKENESNPKSGVTKVSVSSEHATRCQTRRRLSVELNEEARKRSNSSSKNVSSNSTTPAAESSSALASTSFKVECNDKTTSFSAAIHDHQTRKAVQSLVKALKTVVVDLPRLKNLLDDLVQRTSGLQVERLEKLHSQLSLCVYSHRQDYDKTRLMKELDNIISRIEGHWKRTLDAEEAQDL